MRTKNLFWSMLAMSGMLFATSCSQDELVNEPAAAEFVCATFNIGTADVMGSRAIGEGDFIDQVACAVFDEKNNEMTDLRAYKEVENGKASYNIRLAKGQAYRVAFFAYDKDANAYDVTDMKNIKINEGQFSNIEKRDAFTNYIDITAEETMNTISKPVTLYRPFAQINLGIDDTEWADASKAGVVITNTKVVISNVYKAFSAFDNAVPNTAEAATMTFDLNGIPQQLLENVNGKDYNYLAMNYVLVGDKGQEKGLTDIEFVWATADGKTNNPTTHFVNVPAQRNYRTNIIGKLITNPAEFEIEIDARFIDDENVTPNPDYNIYKVFNAFDLQAALDAAPVGEITTIYLGADITGDVIEHQKANRDIVIEGCKYKYDGSIRIHNGSEYNNGTFTIKEVNFATSSEDISFIHAVDFGKENDITRRYSNNITVENCTFIANETATIANITTEMTVVGVKVNASKNLKIINCTATNMHSLLQAESCGGDVTVEKVKTINCQSSVSFNNTKNASISNSTLTSLGEDGYGVRVKGEQAGYSLTVKDCNISAAIPVLVRNMKANGYNITFDGNNTLTNTNENLPAYQVVISNKDYSINKETQEWEALVAPTGTYDLDGADNFKVYPRDYYCEVATWDEFTGALAAGEEKIRLIANISNSTSYSLFNNVLIDLNGKTLAISGATNRLDIGSKNDGSKPKPTVTIKNGNLNCKVYAQTGNVTLTDIKFGGSIAYTGDAQGVITVGYANLLAERCDMANVKANAAETRPRALSSEGKSSGYLILRDCNFPSSSDGTGAFVKTKLLRTYITPLSGNAELEITKCKFGVACNIDLAASYVWSNMNLTGCSGGFTFTISRASTSLTEEESAIIKAIKKNNGGTIKAYYSDKTITY